METKQLQSLLVFCTGQHEDDFAPYVAGTAGPIEDSSVTHSLMFSTTVLETMAAIEKQVEGTTAVSVCTGAGDGDDNDIDGYGVGSGVSVTINIYRSDNYIIFI